LRDKNPAYLTLTPLLFPPDRGDYDHPLRFTPIRGDNNRPLCPPPKGDKKSGQKFDRKNFSTIIGGEEIFKKK